MTNLVEFASITVALAVSVLAAILIGRLSLESFFRLIAPARHVRATRGPTDSWRFQEMK